MLFYSYAELVVGLIAVFLLYFKNFCNCKIQAVLYSVTARCYHYGKHFYVHRRRTKNGVLLFLHFVALTFMPVTLGYSKKMMLI